MFWLLLLLLSMSVHVAKLCKMCLKRKNKDGVIGNGDGDWNSVIALESNEDVVMNSRSGVYSNRNSSRRAKMGVHVTHERKCVSPPRHTVF